jgi:glutathione S-transferase
MNMPLPLRLKGAPGSPYTRKMLALLRYRRIPHALMIPGAAALAGLPVPKVELLPTFYLPGANGELEAATDSTPLIRRFEREFRGRAARPPDAVTAFLDSLLEDYADEWLTKAMFHYRWHYADDIAKAGGILPRWRHLTASDEAAAAAGAQFSQRQIDRLRFVGSNAITAPVIEESYQRFLAIFERHLQSQPYLFGARPAAADFGLYGQLTQLALFDPTPAALTLAQAPRVFAWTSMVDDLSGLEPGDDHWLTRDTLPATVTDLLREAGRTYVPVMLANAQALQSGAAQVEAVVDGKPWVQNPFPYQGKCLKWLREEFAALGDADRKAAACLLDDAGCGALIHA